MSLYRSGTIIRSTILHNLKSPKNSIFSARNFSLKNDVNVHEELQRRRSHQIRNQTSFLKLTPTAQDAISKLLQNASESSEKNQLIIDTKLTDIEEAQEIDSSESISNDVNIPVTPENGGPLKEIRENLPIFSYRQEILNLINNNQVIVLSGATGKCSNIVYHRKHHNKISHVVFLKVLAKQHKCLNTFSKIVPLSNSIVVSCVLSRDV